MIISLIVLSLIFLSLFSIFYIYDPEKLEYSYEVMISPPSEDNWTAFIPFPSDKNDAYDASEILNDMQVIAGNCKYALNSTEKGLALRVTGNGEVHLRASGNQLKDPYVRLSMSINRTEKTQYWVWHNLNGKNMEIMVNLHIKMTYPGPVVPFSPSGMETYDRAEGVAEDSGWTLIEGYSYGTIAD